MFQVVAFNAVELVDLKLRKAALIGLGKRVLDDCLHFRAHFSFVDELPLEDGCLRPLLVDLSLFLLECSLHTLDLLKQLCINFLALLPLLPTLVTCQRL